MATGTVKWFNSTKGFGFIQPDAGGPDVFVHISAVQRSGMTDLPEGQKLSYELVSDKRTGKMSADKLQAEWSEGRKIASAVTAAQGTTPKPRSVMVLQSEMR